MNSNTITTLVRPRTTALVPYILHEIEQGDKAAASASAPHYERAGLGLIELACADDTQSENHFWQEAEEAFGRPKKLLRTWMEIAFDNSEMKSHGPAETLGELLKAKGKQTKSGSRDGDNINRAATKVAKDKRLHFPAVRMRAAEDRKLRQELALELIDIGYRALATKLHPDKRGGSIDAMARLNDVRRMLKALVETR